ncbi:RAB26 protein, partial [Phainopepla nitens]|nr:RAB26 protein [Phainopepla nitens]
QTILVGDSGVGKTSLLVQFDQGKFIPGSFSATVGIGFTVRAQPLGCALSLGEQIIWGIRICESVISTKMW